MTSIRMRRTLCAVLFDKVTALSVESMQKTNAGKIITLISADLFAIERGLHFAPMVMVLPVANLFCYLLIGFYFGWVSSLIVFSCFVVALVVQIFAGGQSKKLKKTDSNITDERLKLVNDVVVGIRTIKCYGWENHYLEKIRQVRSRQKPVIFKFLAVGAIGVSLF